MTDKILIADDEPNILLSLDYLMRREGFEVLQAREDLTRAAALGRTELAQRAYELHTIHVTSGDARARTAAAALYRVHAGLVGGDPAVAAHARELESVRVPDDGSQYHEAVRAPLVARFQEVLACYEATLQGQPGGRGTAVYASWGQGIESTVTPNRSRYTNAGQVLPALKSRQIELGVKRTTPKPDVDKNGFLTWTLELEPHSQAQVRFAYDVSTAPGVQGM